MHHFARFAKVLPLYYVTMTLWKFCFFSTIKNLKLGFHLKISNSLIFLKLCINRFLAMFKKVFRSVFFQQVNYALYLIYTVCGCDIFGDYLQKTHFLVVFSTNLWRYLGNISPNRVLFCFFYSENVLEQKEIPWFFLIQTWFNK